MGHATLVYMLVVMVFARANCVIWGPPGEEQRLDSPRAISLDPANAESANSEDLKR